MVNGKKVFFIWALIALLIAGAFFAVKAIVSRTPDDGGDGIERTTPYSYFYDPEWDVPLEEREGYNEYCEFDRTVMVKDGAASRGMTGPDDASFREEARFFWGYFDAIEAGDAVAYDALFTSEYRSSHEATKPFTPQFIYDREIEYVGTEYVGNNTFYTFDVYYRIFRNDGTFRNDIYRWNVLQPS